MSWDLDSMIAHEDGGLTSKLEHFALALFCNVKCHTETPITQSLPNFALHPLVGVKLSSYAQIEKFDIPSQKRNVILYFDPHGIVYTYHMGPLDAIYPL